MERLIRNKCQYSILDISSHVHSNEDVYIGNQDIANSDVSTNDMHTKVSQKQSSIDHINVGCFALEKSLQDKFNTDHPLIEDNQHVENDYAVKDRSSYNLSLEQLAIQSPHGAAKVWISNSIETENNIRCNSMHSVGNNVSQETKYVDSIPLAAPHKLQKDFNGKYHGKWCLNNKMLNLQMGSKQKSSVVDPYDRPAEELFDHGQASISPDLPNAFAMSRNKKGSMSVDRERSEKSVAKRRVASIDKFSANKCKRMSSSFYNTTKTKAKHGGIYTLLLQQGSNNQFSQLPGPDELVEATKDSQLPTCEVMVRIKKSHFHYASLMSQLGCISDKKDSLNAQTLCMAEYIGC